MMMMKWKFIYYYQLHRALDSTSSFSGSSLFPLLSFTFCSVQFTISTFSAPSALPSLRVRQTQTAQLGRDTQRVWVNLFSGSNIATKYLPFWPTYSSGVSLFRFLLLLFQYICLIFSLSTHSFCIFGYNGVAHWEHHCVCSTYKFNSVGSPFFFSVLLQPIFLANN